MRHQRGESGECGVGSDLWLSFDFDISFSERGIVRVLPCPRAPPCDMNVVEV
jgi:hypothetical protein